MSEFQKIMDDIREWSDKTFDPDHKGRNPVSQLHHLQKEILEVIEAVEHDTPERAYSEYCDCFMLLFDSANHFGMSAEMILQGMKKKLEVNKKRKWGAPDANGVVNHIPE